MVSVIVTKLVTVTQATMVNVTVVVTATVAKIGSLPINSNR